MPKKKKEGKSEQANEDAKQDTSQPWRKILYLEQDYPDNFTPDSFLDCMTVNRDLKTRTLWSIIISALWIADEIILCVSFFSIFELQFSGILKLELLLSITIGMIPLGYSFLYALGTTTSFKEFIVPIYVLLLIVTLFTPVLGSLTQSWSDDTLFFISVLLAIAHCIVHPYSDLQLDFRKPALSINTILLCSLLLSSRFQSIRAIMVFLIYSFVQFILFPMVWIRLKLLYPISTTLVLFCGMLVLGSPCTHIRRALPAVVGFLGFVIFICPGWLKWLEQFKMKIEGPWDYDNESEFKDGWH